jgi:hypothetical protein
MNEYYALRAAGFSDAEVQSDMQKRLQVAGFADQEISAHIRGQMITPDQQAYDALNSPNPELLNYFGRAFMKAQKMGQPAPKSPAYAQPMPEDAAIVDPALHPGDYKDVTAAPDPSMLQAAEAGYQGSVTGLLLRGKLPDALTREQMADLPTSKRLAMQGGALAGDLPAMFLGSLSGAFAQPEAAPLTATAGAFAMPAALRRILMDQYEKGEITNAQEFLQRGAMALWEAAKGGAVGVATYGAGTAAKAFAPVLQLPAEVAAMTTAAAAVEGRIPDAQEFLDGALLIGGMHAATGLGGRAVRTASEITPKLRDIYSRTGVRPEQIVQDAKADPSIAEDVLAMSTKVPRAYADQAGIRRFSDGDVVARITEPAVQEINRLGFETAASDVKITEGTIQHIEDRHGSQLTSQDVGLISRTIEEPTEVLPNMGKGQTEHREASVLLVRDEGKSYVAVVEITHGDGENTLWNYWKMSPDKAEKYLEKYREEKQRRLESGRATEPPSSSQQDLSVQAGKPEGLSGSQTQAASTEKKISSTGAKVNGGEELASSGSGTVVPFGQDRGIMPEGQVAASDAARISDAVKLLEEKIGAPIRTGKLGALGRFAQGIYKPTTEVVRTKVANDITTVTHEVGHHLQKVLFGKIDAQDLAPWESELTPIATKPRPGQSPLPEGFAEFVARYIVNPEQAKSAAPKFLEAFEAKLDKDAPEVKQVLLQAREMVKKWSEQPALMRVLSHISVGDTGKPGFLEKAMSGETWSDLYTSTVDRLNPIDNLVKSGLKPGEKLPADLNPYKLARVYASWSGKAAHFLEVSPIGFRDLKNLGKPLEKILEPVENLDELRAYLIAKSALERQERGMHSEGFMQDARSVVQEMGAKYEPVAQEIYAFKDHVLDYLRDSGVISGEKVEQMRAAWKSHVPFYRVMEAERSGASGGKSMQARNPIKQARGSGRDIIDPLESIIKDTYTFVNMAERNAVVESLVHFAETHDGLGKMVEKVPNPMRATKVQTEEILGALKDNSDLNVQEIRQLFGDSDLATAIFRPDAFLDKKTQVALLRAGQREVYQVDPKIAEVIHGLDQEGMNTLVRYMSYPSRLLRAGATLTPEFLSRNLTRDTFDAYIYSRYGFVPVVDTMRGLFHALKRDDLYHDWVKSGGEHSMFVSLDRENIQKTLQDLTKGSVLDSVRNTIRHPIEAMRMLSEFSEQANRLGEYTKARAALGDSKAAMVEAGFASRDLPLDFARIGSRTRAWNMIVAFWNARVQGLDKMVRAFKEQPVQTSVRAMAAITLPSIALEVANFVDEDKKEQDRVWTKAASGQQLSPVEKDLYMRMQVQELPAWQRDLFWCVPAGDIIWRIPKPFEMGIIFGSVPERVTRWALGQIHKNSDGKEFKELGNSVGGGVWPGIWPTAMAPITENWANKSTMFDRPIVPASREGMLPELQYTPNTTQLMRELSRTVGSLPNMRTFTFSPAKAENLVQGWTGGLGNYALRAADWALRSAGVVPNPPSPDMSVADIPFVRAFVVRYPSASSESIAQFYENYQASQQYVKSIAGLQKEFRAGDAARLLGESDFNTLQGVYQAISAQSAFIHMVNDNPSLDGQKKRELIDSAYLQMTITARYGNMSYENAKRVMHEARRTE